ncbi:MAG TPA: hypothetical protein ENF55_00635 [Thermoprotei archaeon]|nr:hypothetical protein [Thermoprotei archaeon]
MISIDIPLSPTLSILSFTMLLDIYVYAKRLPTALYTMFPLGMLFLSFISCVSRELDHLLCFISFIVVLLALIIENPFAVIPITHYLYFAFMLSVFNIMVLPCMLLTTLLNEVFALVFSYVYLVASILSNILVLLFLSAATKFNEHIKVTRKYLFLSAALAIIAYTIALFKILTSEKTLLPLTVYTSVISALFSYPMFTISMAMALYHVPPVLIEFLRFFYEIIQKILPTYCKLR